jgi:hypothetical protein
VTSRERLLKAHRELIALREADDARDGLYSALDYEDGWNEELRLDEIFIYENALEKRWHVTIGAIYYGRPRRSDREAIGDACRFIRELIREAKSRAREYAEDLREIERRLS